MDLNTRIKDILSKRKVPGFSSDTCSVCSAGCCRRPGFAVFENTLKVYERYCNGLLIRDDFQFPVGMNYKQFITSYFDVVIYNEGDFHTFYPKIMINDGKLLAILPFGNYYSNRDYLHTNNPWIVNYGCIFQNKKRTTQGMEIRCILHNDKIENEVTSKPIDCIFLTCTAQRVVNDPTPSETNEWFSALREMFPDSRAKFESYNV